MTIHTITRQHSRNFFSSELAPSRWRLDMQCVSCSFSNIIYARNLLITRFSLFLICYVRINRKPSLDEVNQVSAVNSRWVTRLFLLFSLIDCKLFVTTTSDRQRAIMSDLIREVKGEGEKKYFLKSCRDWLMICDNWTYCCRGRGWKFFIFKKNLLKL
jgi:hypothetical protein